MKPAARSKHWHVSKPVRAIAYFFGGLFLCYFALVLGFSTSAFRRAALQRTRAKLEEVTGARVEIGRMDINPWAFQVTFYGLVMHGSETGPELPLFVARELVLGASLRTLIDRRTLRLSRLDLEGAAIHLYTRPDGSTNLPGPAAAVAAVRTPPPLPQPNHPVSAVGTPPLQSLQALDDLVDLGVSHFLIAQSSFYWDNREWPLDVSAGGLAVVIRLQHGNYEGSFSAESLHLSNPAVKAPVITASTRLTLGKNLLRLDNVVVRSASLSGNGAITFHWIPSLVSQFSFRAAGEIGPLAGVLLKIGLREGTFTASGEGSYHDGRVDARGRVEGHHIRAPASPLGQNPVELEADYTFEGSKARLPRLTASLLGGTARGAVEVSFASSTPAYTADLDLQDFDVATCIGIVPEGHALLSDFPVESRASGRVRLSGRGARTESLFDLQFGPPATVEGGRKPLTGFLRGSAILAPLPSLEIDAAQFHSAGSTVQIQGATGASSVDLAVQMETTDFSEWKKPAEFLAERSLPAKLDSAATFSGKLTGSPAHLTVTGHFATGNFEYAGSKWAGLQATVSFSPDELRVRSGHLLGAGSTFTFDSTVALQNWQYVSGEPFELSARATKTSIQGLREVLGIQTPLSGEVNGEVQVKESHNQLAGNASFIVSSGSYNGERFDSLDAGISTDGNVWKVTRFTLKKDQGKMTASGSFDPGAQTLSGHAQGSNFSLAGFRRLQNLAPAGGEAGFGGTLGFDLDFQGAVKNPSVRGNVQVQGLEVGSIALGQLSAHLQAGGNQATLQGKLEGPGGTFDFQGSSPMGSWQNLDWPVTASAHYTGLRLDPWMRALGLAAPLGTVEASGEVDYSGTLGGTPAKVKSEVQSVQVKFTGLEWKNDHPFDISLEKQHFEITPFNLEGPSTEFRFQGSADLGAVGTLNLQAEGQIDAQFLHVFDPALLTTGRFGLQVNVQGSFRQPLLYGTLKVNDVSLGYPGLPLRLAGLNGDINLEGDRLTVRSLRSEAGPATIGISGSATLSGTPRYNLQAQVSHVRVAYPVQFVSVISGTIRLSGTPGAGVLSGDLGVEQMFVGQNFNVLNWASALASQPATTLEGSPLSSGVRMDVRVSTSPTVSVESRDLSAVASIDLSLRGTLADPIVFGNVHIQSGQAVLRQTNYKLSHGDVILANPLHTEPVLDLEATTRIQQYDLVLRITGPADNPNISYRSDPPLSTPAILALLAFGYSSQDQLMANTGRSSFSTQGASALLSQALSSQVSSRVTRLFGLSRISIDPNPISTGGTQVTVEERIARDFTITYVTTTGGIVERIIKVEWDLSDTMSLLGIRDQNGVYGFELDFRKRFK